LDQWVITPINPPFISRFTPIYKPSILTSWYIQVVVVALSSDSPGPSPGCKAPRVMAASETVAFQGAVLGGKTFFFRFK